MKSGTRTVVTGLITRQTRMANKHLHNTTQRHINPMQLGSQRSLAITPRGERHKKIAGSPRPPPERQRKRELDENKGLKTQLA